MRDINTDLQAYETNAKFLFFCQGSDFRVKLVFGEGLDKAKAEFESLTSVHVHDLSTRDVGPQDFVQNAAADCKLPRTTEFSGIVNPTAVPRSQKLEVSVKISTADTELYFSA